LSKNSKPVEEELYNAIKRNDPGRLELLADDSVDLEGSYHVLRKLENRLVSMTPEQTNYALSHPIREISKVSLGKGQ
jgi:glutamine synthetase adenylyltransferase